MGRVEIRSVSKAFDGTPVLTDLDLAVEAGELLVVIGPSGSGKTTLLRLVAGLERPDEGAIVVDGEEVDPVAPSRAGVAMVFQDEALYEHLRVGANITFPLLVGGVSRDEAVRRGRSRAGRVGIGRLWERMPGSLSGGERGLVAGARALARPSTKVLLVDEPLAKADRGLRIRFRSELRRIHEDAGITTIVATNDQEEAMAMADRLVLLHEGRVRQDGPPLDVYQHPVDATVAGFVGSPPMNLMPGLLRLDDGVARLEVGTDRLRLERVPQGADRGRRVLVGLHAHELHPAPQGTPFDRVLHMTVGAVEDLGAGALVRAGLGTTPSIAYAFHVKRPAAWRPGARLEVTWTVGRLRLFDAASGETIPM
jgi:ABC-type sugar transport system ATPase subunit